MLFLSCNRLSEFKTVEKYGQDIMEKINERNQIRRNGGNLNKVQCNPSTVKSFTDNAGATEIDYTDRVSVLYSQTFTNEHLSTAARIFSPDHAVLIHTLSSYWHLSTTARIFRPDRAPIHTLYSY